VVLKLRLNPTPVIMMILLNLAISLSIPGISLLDHLGGLVVGALLTAAVVYAPARNKAVWQLGVFAIVTVALVSLIVVRDGQINKLSCVTTDQSITCVDRSSS
jgi:hypothetical protein